MSKNSSIQTTVGNVKLPSPTCFRPHHSQAEARCQAGPKPLPWTARYEIIDESGSFDKLRTRFVGWVDEKVRLPREAAPHAVHAGLGDNGMEFTYSHLPVSRKQSHPQHLTISRFDPDALRADEE